MALTERAASVVSDGFVPFPSSDDADPAVDLHDVTLASTLGALVGIRVALGRQMCKVS